MNGRGLFDRYMDVDLFGFLNEAVETDNVDFEDDEVTQKLTPEESPNEIAVSKVMEDANKVADAILKLDIDDENVDKSGGYLELQMAEGLLSQLGYTKCSKISAAENINPRVIVKKVVDADKILTGDSNTTAEKIDTRVFDPTNVDRIRQSDFAFSPNASEDDINRFIKSSGYGTGMYTGTFKNYHPMLTGAGVDLCILTVPFEIKNGKVVEKEGEKRTLSARKVKDISFDENSGIASGKEGKEMPVLSIGAFNKRYTYTGKMFRSKDGNEYPLFTSASVADNIYAFVRDKYGVDYDMLSGEEKKSIFSEIATNKNWEERARRSKEKHETEVASKVVDKYKVPYNYYYNDYVKVANGIVMGIRLVYGVSFSTIRPSHIVNGKKVWETKKVPKGCNIVLVKGMILKNLPPSMASEGVPQIIAFINNRIKMINGASLYYPRASYGNKAIGFGGKRLAMDDDTKCRMAIMNTVGTFYAVYRSGFFTGGKIPSPEFLKTRYNLSRIPTTLQVNGKFINIIPFNVIKKYMDDFIGRFVNCKWEEIKGVETLTRNDIFPTIKNWCMRQLAVLRDLISTEVSEDKTVLRQLAGGGVEFENNTWAIKNTDIHKKSTISEPTTQDQAVMESLRRRLLEYCE